MLTEGERVREIGEKMKERGRRSRQVDGRGGGEGEEMEMSDGERGEWENLVTQI